MRMLFLSLLIILSMQQCKSMNKDNNNSGKSSDRAPTPEMKIIYPPMLFPLISREEMDRRLYSQLRKLEKIKRADERMEKWFVRELSKRGLPNSYAQFAEITYREMLQRNARYIINESPSTDPSKVPTSELLSRRIEERKKQGKNSLHPLSVQTDQIDTDQKFFNPFIIPQKPIPDFSFDE